MKTRKRMMAQRGAVSESRNGIEKTAAESALANYATTDLYRELLQRFHEDPDRDGLLQTPSRVEKSMAFLTGGYEQNASKILQGALFDVDYDEMVMVKDVEMYSLCEH